MSEPVVSREGGLDGIARWPDTRPPRARTHVCTAADPWAEEKGRYAQHPDSVHLRDEEHDGGDCDVRRCPHCHLTFHVELPD